MITEVTEGVKVSVGTQYEDDFSNPANRHYIFSYKITIENQNPFSIQLLRRHWFIKDTLSNLREVEGEGVIGQQPVLAPGDVYEYESACNLSSDIGSMRGTYLFRKDNDGKLFKVSIPEFFLVTNARLN
jgi:ApaG protein